MVKTFRDAEIQIEELRDKLRSLQVSISPTVTEDFVKKEINTAIRKIKIPVPVVEQSNIFSRIFIRSNISGRLQPNVEIDSYNTTKVRLGRILDQDRFDITVNAEYTGSAWEQDDATKTSLKFLMMIGATDATSFFEMAYIPIGSTTVTSLYQFTNANIRPVTTTTYNLGQSDLRWNTIYGASLDITTALAASMGGTGKTSFGSHTILSGNSTAVEEITGGSNSIEVVTNATISYSTGDHEGITYVSDVDINLTTVNLDFTYGVFTGTS